MGEEKTGVEVQNQSEEKLIYSFNDKWGKPQVTICLMNKEGKWSRGIAIRSKQDHHNETTAINKAEGRAEKAFKQQSTCLPINRDEAIRSLYESNAMAFKCKAEYGVDLSMVEQAMLSTVRADSKDYAV